MRDRFKLPLWTLPVPIPTPRGNKYLLTFVDHFSKYAEAFAIPEQTAEVCARVYAREIVTCHGTGSVLVTDQGSAFMSSFFSDKCKVLGIQTTQTSSYPESNGVAEVAPDPPHRSLAPGKSFSYGVGPSVILLPHGLQIRISSSLLYKLENPPYDHQESEQTRRSTTTTTTTTNVMNVKF